MRAGGVPKGRVGSRVAGGILAVVVVWGLGLVGFCARTVPARDVKVIAAFVGLGAVFYRVSIVLSNGVRASLGPAVTCAASLALGPAAGVLSSLGVFANPGRSFPWLFFRVAQVALSSRAAAALFSATGGKFGMVKLAGDLWSLACFVLGFAMANAVLSGLWAVLGAGARVRLAASGAVRRELLPQVVLAAAGVFMAAVYLQLGIGALAVFLGLLLVARVVVPRHPPARELAGAGLADEQTGVYSYRYFRDRLQEQISKAEAERTDFAVVILDIDGLKELNYRFGRAVGDRILRRVAAVIADGVRAEDVVARYGGDEFVVILPGADEKGAASVAKRLKERIENDVAAQENLPERVAVSIGVSAWGQFLSREHRLLELADHALALAKQGKGGRLVLASQLDADEE